MINYGWFQSPIGEIRLAESDGEICELFFCDRDDREINETAVLRAAFQQLEEYFAGARQKFDLPLQPQGTAFQQQVWKALLDVPFGQTAAYLDIALKLGDRKKIRAVGAANGRNPVSIIIPCHRIIGSNGNLIGYGGGLWRKEWLLKHEGALLL